MLRELCVLCVKSCVTGAASLSTQQAFLNALRARRALREVVRGGRSKPFLIFVLQLVQLEVDPALGEELLVRARFPQVPLVQDEDLVHVLDGGKAMGDRDG